MPKHTRPEPLLTREVLAFVRDHAPTAKEFVVRFGEQVFHVLRKSGIFDETEGRLRLRVEHLTADGTAFIWGTMRVHLDDDIIDYFCTRNRNGSNEVG